MYLLVRVVLSWCFGGLVWVFDWSVLCDLLWFVVCLLWCVSGIRGFGLVLIFVYNVWCVFFWFVLWFGVLLLGFWGGCG